MASRVATLLLLAVVCAGLLSAQILPDCCKSVSAKRLPLQVIERYSVQDEGRGCDIKATVIFTRGGRKLCVSHPDDQEWVRQHIAHLNNSTRPARKNKSARN